jgi:hypothetical protein
MAATSGRDGVAAPLGGTAATVVIPRSHSHGPAIRQARHNAQRQRATTTFDDVASGVDGVEPPDALMQWGRGGAEATPDESVAACATNHGLFVTADGLPTEDTATHDARFAQLAKIHRENQAAVSPTADMYTFQTELVGTVDFAGGILAREVTRDALPLSRLADEHLFMREPTPDCVEERPCRNGDECEARHLAGVVGVDPWTMREFLFPVQRERLRDDHELPSVPGLCLFCLKRNAMIHYGTLLYINQDAHVTVQPFVNLCDEPGEFDSRFCLLPGVGRFLGILAPMAQHNVGMYTMEVDAAGRGFAAYTDAVYFRLAPVETPAVRA